MFGFNGLDLDRILGNITGAPSDVPTYKIRCTYKLTSGADDSVLLPYEYTSDTNCQLALQVFRSLGDDLKLVLQENGRAFGASFIPFHPQYTVEQVRG